MLQVHIIFIMTSLACLAISFLSAIIFLIQNSNIKRKRFGKLTRALPSVDTADRWMLIFIVVGFFSMTIGLTMGVALAHKSWSQIWTSQPDILFSIICWFFYGILLAFRFVFGWRGRRLSVLNIVGFIAVLFTLFGIERVFGKGIHNFF